LRKKEGWVSSLAREKRVRGSGARYTTAPHLYKTSAKRVKGRPRKRVHRSREKTWKNNRKRDIKGRGKGERSDWGAKKKRTRQRWDAKRKLNFSVEEVYHRVNRRKGDGKKGGGAGEVKEK